MNKIARNIVYTRMVYGSSYGTNRVCSNRKEIKFEFAVNEQIVKIDITNGSSSIIEAWSLGFGLFESTNLSVCVHRI